MLKKELMKSDNKYELTKIEHTLILTIDGKIFIPIAIRQKVIAWYHEYLCHPGTTRTEAATRGTMTWPGLTRNVQTYCKTCRLCQFDKKTRKECGKLPVMLHYSHSRNPSCARTDARTNPSAQRATQLRSVLARVYSFSRHNLNTTTVP
jgi:hypothetical protein